MYNIKRAIVESFGKLFTRKTSGSERKTVNLQAICPISQQAIYNTTFKQDFLLCILKKKISKITHISIKYKFKIKFYIENRTEVRINLYMKIF